MKKQPFTPHDYTLRPLAEYATRLPSRQPGKRIHKSTLWRWATKGSNGVILETMKLAQARFTSDGWVNDFMRECTRRSRLKGAESLPSPESSSESIRRDFGIGPGPSTEDANEGPTEGEGGRRAR